MSQSEMESKSIANENELKVIRKEKGPEGEEFIVKHRETGNICAIIDTFADTCSRNEMAHSVLGKTPFFLFSYYVYDVLC